MSKMKKTLYVVEGLRDLANRLEELVEAIQSNEPVSEELSATSSTNSPSAVPTPTFEEVRAKLSALSQAGKQREVKQLITSFGVEKLSGIPKEKYSELLKKARQL